VAPLPEGYGGHREGGWEAIAGTGSSWGERSVAAIAHENSAVIKQVGVKEGGGAAVMKMLFSLLHENTVEFMCV